MDVFTRGIRSWHLGRSLEQELTITALGRAFERGHPEIHHSDQGVQYAATAYVEMLTSVGAQISMTSVGEPEENLHAEGAVHPPHLAIERVAGAVAADMAVRNRPAVALAT